MTIIVRACNDTIPTILLIINMDRIELIVWISYVAFVAIGLLIFISISCYVRSKIHKCEIEQEIVHQYNKRLELARGHKPAATNPYAKKETFSLFNLLS